MNTNKSKTRYKEALCILIIRQPYVRRQCEIVTGPENRGLILFLIKKIFLYVQNLFGVNVGGIYQ
jgi:hypothetical protein